MDILILAPWCWLAVVGVVYLKLYIGLFFRTKDTAGKKAKATFITTGEM